MLTISDDLEEGVTKDVAKILIKEVQVAVVSSNVIKLSSGRLTQ